MTKVCTKCKIEKTMEEFPVSKEAKSGRGPWCNLCCAAYQREYRQRPETRIKQKEYYAKPETQERKRRNYANPQTKANKKEWRSRPEVKQHKAEYDCAYFALPEKIQRRSNWHKQDRLKNRERRSEQLRLKKANDPQFRLSCSLRDRLNKAIRGKSKVGSAVRDLGCSIEFLRQYLESKFQAGMTWDNWGRPAIDRDTWNLDHIVPLSRFDLTDKEQFLRACHYTNLQPLWAIDNLRKGNR